jgi:nucleoside-diphosphate-sugar epimerase/predicted dehydrogenase
MSQNARRRVILVGAGQIAETHAAVLAGFNEVELVAVIDRVPDRASKFAKRWQIGKTFTDVAELIGSGQIADVAHVLVPPRSHMPVASKLLRTGAHVLIEKPLAQSKEECDTIAAAAVAGNAFYQVNHNAIHQAVHRIARAWIENNKFGRLRHIIMHYNMPLRQLAARQLGHWMFDSPRNLLLEQAVHPLSQIDDLIGPITEAHCQGAPMETIGGWSLTRTFLVSLLSDRGTAQLHFSVGETFPAWGAILICDDGAISIDYANNRVTAAETRRWPEAFGRLQNGISQGRSVAVQELSNIMKFTFSTVGLRPRTDSFFSSMHESIRSFYASINNSGPDGNFNQGARLVALCAEIAAHSGAKLSPTIRTPARSQFAADVLVIGGTGFIGQHVVPALVNKGKNVRVVARSIRRLPPVFYDPKVSIVEGDALSYRDIRSAIGSATQVINLAHGGSGSAPAEIRDNMVQSALTVAEACVDARVERLVFISSIAALYLGSSRSVITGRTPTDPHPEFRAPYARGKAEAEQALLALHRDRSLPVCILRPGVVIGEGGIAFHSALGYFNAERHCMGWNRGRNPLPFVLVSDVAEAILKALDAPNALGRCYNIVGETPLTACEYIEELSQALERPLRFYPQSVYKIFAVDLAKYVLKVLSGRQDSPQTLYDLRSRGLRAHFDCRDATEDLGWRPITDRAQFLQAGIDVHGRGN